MSSSVDKFEPLDNDSFRDFHAVYTVQLIELIHDGLIDFTDGTWNTTIYGASIDWYSDEQRDRFWDKFKNFYLYREIGELPYLRWKTDVLTRAYLLMPKYKLLYEVLDNVDDLLKTGDEYGKLRYINSEFPQTLLSGNSDYASDGTDKEHELIKEDDYIKKLNELLELDAIDNMLIKEFESMFYCLFTSNINGL